MKFLENRVEDIKIAYIGGGSKGWAWKFMFDLALEESIAGVVYLYDIDQESARKNESLGNKLYQREDLPGKWKYKAVDGISEALDKADFVIVSILPGTFHEMESDVHIPEKYGIYQSVGDTTGPGGLFRSLRTVPIYKGFAQAIKEFCPNAWVINYTNPMAICMRTLYTVFPEIKAFGCCHEVFAVQNMLAKALKEIEGLDVSREEINTNVLGVNHFTWINKAAYKGIDLLPVYKKFVEKYYDNGFEDRGKWEDSYFDSANRVKFDLFQKYRCIAAAGDRHLAEFVPSWYLKDPETVGKWKFQLTPVSWRMKNQEQLIEKRERMLEGGEEIQIHPSGEEGIQQIKALLGLKDIITNVNLPNKGQMGDVPHNTIVETNAFFTKNAVYPMVSGKLPKSVQSLLNVHIFNQEIILEAAMERNKQLAFQAFLNDPAVSTDYDNAQKLFDEMLYNTKKYLVGWDI
ncbi:MAG: alpha-glucosidase/alpha-galactosidase [Bacillota bacterium]